MNTIVHSAYYSSEKFKESSHYHDCHEMIFVLSGEIELYVNQAKYNVHSGQIAIFSRYENHYIKVISQKYERYIMRISPFSDVDENKAYSLFLNRSSGFGNVIDVSDCTNSIKYLFDEIISELNKSDEMSAQMQHYLVSQLLITLYRRSGADALHFDDENFDMIYKIQRMFENDVKRAFTLEQLANDFHVSKSTLSHQFKKITGFSVFEYLISCRIASAKYFLSKTNHSIGEIVEKCGFGDNSNFTQAFKKHVGITPSDFRKKFRTL